MSRRAAALGMGMVLVAAAVALGATQWTAQSPATPGRSAELQSVACPAVDDCIAVGLVERGPALAERWNGSQWSVMKTAKVGRLQSPYLRAVACPSTRFCMAAGGGGTGNDTSALTERWNGSRWTRVPVPRPPGLSTTFYPNFDLAGISCRTQRDCTAVGAFIGRSNFAQPLVERWNGSRWRFQPSPRGSRFLSRLLAVDCPAANSCLAAGQAYTSKLGRYSFTTAMSWNGRRWRLLHPPTVAGRTQAELDGIYCTGTHDCEVVGGAPNGPPLALHWTGSWTRQAVAQPSFPAPILSGVFCASASSCVASAYTLSLDAGGGYVYSWDGKSWTYQALPEATNRFWDSLGLGCFDITACEMAGGLWTHDPTRPGSRLTPVAFGEGAAAGNAATASRAVNGRIFFYRLLVNGGGDIFAVQPSGSGFRRVARDGMEPSVSRDGRLIAFQGEQGCGRTACQVRDIAVMNADGSHRRAIPGTDNLANAEYPSFSPDGAEIVFDDGAQSIWAANTDGSNLHRLASLQRGISPSAPMFSQDGKTIVFTEYKVQTGNEIGVFRMDADGTHVRRASKVAAYATSPDGRTVVFSCGHGLCRMSPNGSHRRRLTNPPRPVPVNTAPVVDGAARFSPDGTKIVFARYAGNLGPGRWNGPHGLYVMNANGSHLRKLDGNGNDDGPSWQPKLPG